MNNKIICWFLLSALFAGLQYNSDTTKEVTVPTQVTEVEETAPVALEPEINCIFYDALPLSYELQEYTYNECTKYSCEDYYELMLAVMWQESHFNAAALSSTNDYGIMQINKINHKSLSTKLGVVDFLDAKQNISAGVYMLSNLLGKYDTEHAALMAYNLGEGGARRKWQNGIYSTTYSHSVMEKKEKIKANIYL